MDATINVLSNTYRFAEETRLILKPYFVSQVYKMIILFDVIN